MQCITVQEIGVITVLVYMNQLIRSCGPGGLRMELRCIDVLCEDFVRRCFMRSVAMAPPFVCASLTLAGAAVRS